MKHTVYDNNNILNNEVAVQHFKGPRIWSVADRCVAAAYTMLSHAVNIQHCKLY